jgi:hypothetical protein
MPVRRELWNTEQRLRRAKYRAAGGCWHCGHPTTRFNQCLPCRVRAAAYARKRYAEKRAHEAA